MLNDSTKKSNSNSTRELSWSNEGTNAKQRMTNLQQVLRGKRCLAALSVCTSALQKFKPKVLYLERFLKTICRRFPLSRRQKLHSCWEPWPLGTKPLTSFFPLFFLKGWDTCKPAALSAVCAPAPLCTSSLRLAAVTHILRRRIWGPHGIHVNTAAQPIRGNFEGVTAVSAQGRASPKRCVSIFDPYP